MSHPLATLCARLYYRRITRIGTVPAAGPVLYVALHRNGAVDGFVYHCVAPRAEFLVSVQLLRSPWGRLLFRGIPVARDKDRGDRSMNREAMERCVAHLAAGGELMIFPEGTSDLGPRHLSFKSGAARILARTLEHGAQPAVVPLAVFYRAAERLRSDVIVAAGDPISTTLDPALDDAARVATLMERITSALESLGVNVDTAEELERVERLAAVRADGDAAAYHRALMRLPRLAPPPAVADAWRRVERAIAQHRMATEYGAPVYSRRSLAWSVAWAAVQAPIVAAAAVVNIVPLAAALAAGRVLADARNTIALWRLLVGLPALIVWLGVVTGTSLALGVWWAVPLYLAITLLGIAMWPELVARAVRLYNRLRARDLAPSLDAVRAWLRHAVPDA